MKTGKKISSYIEMVYSIYNSSIGGDLLLVCVCVHTP